MKVALTFPGCHRRAGVERIMLECANFLSHRGHETHVFASDWEVEALAPAIVRHQVPMPRRPAAFSMIAFNRRCRRELDLLRPAPDVLASFGVQSPPGGVLWVQSVHRAWLEISRRHRSLGGRLKQRINPFHAVALRLEEYQFGGRNYRKLIALTEAVKGDLMRLYGVPSDDVAVIPNGYSPEEFNPERCSALRASMRAKLAYRDSDRVVIFVANELDRKGFRPLMRSVASLNDPALRLLAVGRLSAAACAAEIRALGLADRVHFTGPTNDAASYFAAADVFALPTEYEAWGLVIVEALACGLPALTSRLAGAAVVVREGDTGELLDDPRNEDEIARKLASLLARCPSAGNGASGAADSRHAISQSVARFAWSNLLLKYEDILAECAGAGPPSERPTGADATAGADGSSKRLSTTTTVQSR